MKFIALKTKDGSSKGNITFFCRVLHVSRQGYYQYLVMKDRPWKYQPLADAMKDILTEDICNEEIYNAGFAAEPVKLGYDEFFVLGDNRNNSDDSRYSNIGTVKRDMIIGKPWLRIKPASDFGKINYKTEKNGSDSNGGE